MPCKIVFQEDRRGHWLCIIQIISELCPYIICLYNPDNSAIEVWQIMAYMYGCQAIWYYCYYSIPLHGMVFRVVVFLKGDIFWWKQIWQILLKKLSVGNLRFTASNSAIIRTMLSVASAKLYIPQAVVSLLLLQLIICSFFAHHHCSFLSMVHLI